MAGSTPQTREMNPDLKDQNLLALSWHDTTKIPHLNPSNVLDYFCDRCNPFYQKTCNNEILRMQNRDLEQLGHMIGTEYIVLHVQEPILYVIRKQHRSSPTQTTPLADYYILAGFVYQAPDLQSVVNSRFTTCVHHLTSAFDETISYMKYHPTKGYSWDFGKDSAASSSDKTKDKDRAKDKLMRGDFGSTFQRRRVDLLLAELSKKFPHKNQAAAADVKADAAIEPGGKVAAAADGTAVRSEKQGDVTNVQSAAGLKRTSDAVGPLSKAMRSN